MTTAKTKHTTITPLFCTWRSIEGCLFLWSGGRNEVMVTKSLKHRLLIRFESGPDYKIKYNERAADSNEN